MGLSFIGATPRRPYFAIAALFLGLVTGSLEATRLVSYQFRGETRLGVWTSEGVIDLNRAYREMLDEEGVPRAEARAEALVPPEIVAFLSGEEESLREAQRAISWVNSKRASAGASSQGGNALDRLLREKGIWFLHDEIRLGPAIPNPPRLMAIGLNFREHAEETGMKVPDYPIVFSKAGRVVGPGDIVQVPRAVEQVDYEVELAVVIGKRASAVSVESAYDYVAGYMTFNDLTARDFQFRVSQWMLGKSPDDFSAMGPFLVLKDEVPDPHSLRLTARVGVEILQDSTTADMVFSVAELISYISQVMTLVPGTIIATGTPPGVGAGRTPPRFLRSGERIRVEVEGLGSLENEVVFKSKLSN